MKEDLEMMGLLIFIVLCVVSFVVLLCSVLLRQTCKKTYSDYQISYTMFGGCKIQQDGVMLPELLFKQQYKQNVNINNLLSTEQNND